MNKYIRLFLLSLVNNLRGHFTRCKNLPAVKDGNWKSPKCSSEYSPVGTKCNIVCDVDPQLMSSIDVTCTNKGWVNPYNLHMKPSCDWCKNLPVVKDGQWNLPECSSEYSPVGTKCNIVCDADPQLMSSIDVSCTDKGWSNPYNLHVKPSCDWCKNLPQVKDGQWNSLKCSAEYSPVGTKCNIVCNADPQRMSSIDVTCTESGWDNPYGLHIKPSCDWCKNLPQVKGGHWNSPQCSAGYSPVGTKCNVICDTDTQLMSSFDVTCTDRGWYDSFGLHTNPSCDWCKNLPQVKGGHWSLPQCSAGYSPVGTKCNVICDADPQLMSSIDVTCTNRGWDDSSGLHLKPSCDSTTQTAVSMGNSISQALNVIAQSHQKAAMLFVLDESGSVGTNDFKIEKDFVEAVVTAFPLSYERSAGVITFSSGTPNTDISLQMKDTCSFISQLRGINFSGGGTDLPGALVHARSEINSISYGYSKPITLIFVITDGLSDGNPYYAAQDLRNQGHIVFTIGVANFDRAQLEPLSSRHQTTGAKLFYGVPNFEVFRVIANYLKTNYNAGNRQSCP